MPSHNNKIICPHTNYAPDHSHSFSHNCISIRNVAEYWHSQIKIFALHNVRLSVSMVIYSATNIIITSSFTNSRMCVCVCWLSIINLAWLVMCVSQICVLCVMCHINEPSSAIRWLRVFSAKTSFRIEMVLRSIGLLQTHTHSWTCVCAGSHVLCRVWWWTCIWTPGYINRHSSRTQNYAYIYMQ